MSFTWEAQVLRSSSCRSRTASSRGRRPAPAAWPAKAFLHVALDALDHVAPVAARLLHRFRQRRMAPRRRCRKEVPAAAVGLVEAEAVRDRRVDLQRLAGDAHALGRRHRPMVRMLCSRSASLMRMTRTSRAIASSILEGLGTVIPRASEAQLVELGEAVDEVGGGALEALDQLGLGDAAILHRVVHQRGHDGLHVQLPFGAGPATAMGWVM